MRFTWDETDADRQEVVRRAAAKGGDVDDTDIRAYLADSSEEEEQSGQSVGGVEGAGGRGGVVVRYSHGAGLGMLWFHPEVLLQ